MKKHFSRFLVYAVVGLLLLFFSNDFGLIDIEKTAIITAVAVDYENGEYKATAQIAVPEATDTTSENERAQISGTGSTIGSAIKDIGDKSGWYPNLYFCNMIIVGSEFKDKNVITVLDYFSNTLRVQDSALVIMTDGKASDILAMSTPLDNISSFALQKILLKNPGFDSDVIETDIKEFCIDYYSVSESSYMPYVKKVDQKDENENKDSGGASPQSESGGNKDMGGAKGTSLFTASTTALFYKGYLVGELDENLTLAFNILDLKMKGTTIEVKDVETQNGKINYLITILKNKYKISLKENNGRLFLDVKVDLYVKVSDRNDVETYTSFATNDPVPKPVLNKATEELTKNIYALIDKEIETGCDFLKLKQKLYRFNHKVYDLYKDDYSSRLVSTVKVNISGQK